MFLPHVYLVSKYDPADYDRAGTYAGSLDPRSDHGPVEAAYLATLAAFAAESEVRSLTVREPQLASFVSFGLETPLPGNGLTGLFASDLHDYHDGAEIPLSTGLHLVRAMLRDNGAWCRLEVPDRFLIHVGADQYVYVGSDRACPDAVSFAAGHGLFAVRITSSPYAFEDDPEAVHTRRAADDTFWHEVGGLLLTRGVLLLEERHVGNAVRWHRVDSGTLPLVRAGLAPRSIVALWPALDTDIDAVAAATPVDSLVEVVWQTSGGTITSTLVDDLTPESLRDRLRGATAARVISCLNDDRRPLVTAVLPDPDGTLRARWTY